MTAAQIDPAALVLVLARTLAVGTLFVTFGTLLIRTAIAGDAAGGVPGLARLAWSALAAAPIALLLWATLQTAALAETATAAAAVKLLPGVLGGTAFGHLILIRLGLLGLTAAALALGRGGRVAATVAAGGAATLQAAHLHALAMSPGPTLLLAGETLHVLAAAAWLGGLPALLILVRTTAPAMCARVARRFAPLGIACVLALAASAALQAWTLVGSTAALFGTPYGWVCLAKLSLFVVLVALAAHNRMRLVPRLGRGAVTARVALARDIAAAIAAGTLVLLLAALLSALPPAIDALSAPPP